MSCRTLTALPVYNEADYVTAAVAGALTYCRDVLVVDDGSTDGTSQLLAARDDIRLIRHPTNQGYGTALRSAFDFAIRDGYDVLVTIDCDGQHQPQLISDVCRTLLPGRRGHCFRQPLLAAISGRQRSAGRAPPRKSSDYRGGQSAAGPEFDRRLLRVQGISRAGIGED